MVYGELKFVLQRDGHVTTALLESHLLQEPIRHIVSTFQLQHFLLLVSVSTIRGLTLSTFEARPLDSFLRPPSPLFTKSSGHNIF